MLKFQMRVLETYMLTITYLDAHNLPTGFHLSLAFYHTKLIETNVNMDSIKMA